MEEDCGGGQGLTKGCGAKGRRSIQILCVNTITKNDENISISFSQFTSMSPTNRLENIVIVKILTPVTSPSGPLQCRYPTTTLHGVTTQNTSS